MRPLLRACRWRLYASFTTPLSQSRQARLPPHLFSWARKSSTPLFFFFFYSDEVVAASAFLTASLHQAPSSVVARRVGSTRRARPCRSQAPSPSDSLRRATPPYLFHPRHARSSPPRIVLRRPATSSWTNRSGPRRPLLHL
jgi:hypothetical protein